jgi:hypothetical protein
MALINCPECYAEISDRAVSCIKCGFSLKKANGKPFKFPARLTGIIVAVVVLAVVFGIFSFLHSPEQQILGRWETNESGGRAMEFFNNGTAGMGMAGNVRLSWRIGKHNRLILTESGWGSQPDTVNIIEISRNRLILEFRHWGHSERITFERPEIRFAIVTAPNGTLVYSNANSNSRKVGNRNFAKGERLEILRDGDRTWSKIRSQNGLWIKVRTRDGDGYVSDGDVRVERKRR